MPPEVWIRTSDWQRPAFDLYEFDRHADEIVAQWRPSRRYEPTMSEDRRADLMASWHRAVDRARNWASG